MSHCQMKAAMSGQPLRPAQLGPAGILMPVFRKNAWAPASPWWQESSLRSASFGKLLTTSISHQPQKMASTCSKCFSCSWKILEWRRKRLYKRGKIGSCRFGCWLDFRFQDDGVFILLHKISKKRMPYSLTWRPSWASCPSFRVLSSKKYGESGRSFAGWLAWLAQPLIHQLGPARIYQLGPGQSRLWSCGGERARERSPTYVESIGSCRRRHLVHPDRAAKA